MLGLFIQRALGALSGGFLLAALLATSLLAQRSLGQHVRAVADALPGYVYERHVGGALCMFVRGHAAPGQGLYCERPSKALIDAMDALFEGLGDSRPGASRGAAA